MAGASFECKKGVRDGRGKGVCLHLQGFHCSEGATESTRTHALFHFNSKPPKLVQLLPVFAHHLLLFQKFFLSL